MVDEAMYKFPSVSVVTRIYISSAINVRIMIGGITDRFGVSFRV